MDSDRILIDALGFFLNVLMDVRCIFIDLVGFFVDSDGICKNFDGFWWIVKKTIGKPKKT